MTKRLTVFDVDIVNICTPSGAHAEIAVEAARAGKHVIVEKPIEISLERSDTIITACRENKVKLMVIFPSRFDEAARLMKQAVDEGKFGKITLADCYTKWYRGQSYYDEGGWKGTMAFDGGGALMNQSIHTIDLLQWFLGPVECVQAFSGALAHERIEVEDTAVAVVKFKNGALGVIEGTTAMYPGFLKKIEIGGSKGSAIMEEEDILFWQFEDETEEDKRIREKFSNRKSGGGGAADPSAINHDKFTRQFENFLEAVEKNTDPLVTGEEGRKSVEIILAIYQSSKEGRPVYLGKN